MNNKEGFPSEENPFTSLHQLLYTDDHQVALSAPSAIATAIENHGIWGWDRFGRFKFFAPDSVEAQKALDMVAIEYEYQNQSQPHSLEQEHFHDMFDTEHPALGLGWAEDKKPAFTSDSNLPENPVRNKSAETKAGNSLYKIIAALCHGFNFDISEANSTRVATVLDYLGQIDDTLDGNTIRDHLKIANKLIEK